MCCSNCFCSKVEDKNIYEKKSKKPKKKIENQSGLYLKQSYARNNQPIYHNKQLKEELQTIQNFDTLIDANGQRIYQQPS